MQEAELTREGGVRLPIHCQGDPLYFAFVYSSPKKVISMTNKEEKKVLFGAVIARGLKDRRISQAALGDMLGVSRNTVTNWVADKYKPEHDLIVKLCGILGLSLEELYGTGSSEGISAVEKRLLDSYRLLSDSSKRAVERIVVTLADEELAEQDRYLKSSFRLIEVPSAKAAAGQGFAFSGEASRHVFIRKNELNRRADAIIEVSGDSMLPVYHDGDFVYVEYADSARPGQDVICTTADGGVIKRLTADYRLESVNPDLPFGDRYEDDNVRIAGIVLGLVDGGDRPTDRENEALHILFEEELRSLDAGSDE